MNHYKYNPETLRYEPVKARLYTLKTLGVLAICLAILGFSTAIKVNTIIQRVPVYLEHKEEPCNAETVKAYIKTLNLRFPDIVYRQILLESNYFKSPICHDLNNLTCMEVAAIRPTLGQDVGHRFARFNNWKESIIDYALWQASFAKEVRNEEEYYELLDKVYSPYALEENKGPLYSTRLKKIAL